ncbi:hypothetical protein HP570_05705 [Brevibacillus sp. RS1.1]|uniref:hypothetical protein n=1 Tax=Brevibacillus sp. RS1.1 TaxID=2738982 RepID=UPI00156B89B3|nr:hypothetical protein [Brevibacillus sp. RS1.1]NRR01711.1 hypothetical protein [Brevibacillus sp. RS1.1]
MKKHLLLSCLLISLLGILVPGQINASAPAKADPRKPEPVVIYQVPVDGKVTKTVTNMTLIHRASMSPSGRFVYGERIGYGKADRTIPYLYDMQTKKMTQLSGYGKWSPKQDTLYVRENGGIVKLSLPDGKKTVLVPAAAQYPVLDFSVSPDEQYMVFTRMDMLSSNSKVSGHLILQHLPTLKMKKNDQYEWPSGTEEERYYWVPNSKKLFYKTQTAYKELDLPTGLKYDHNMTAFPSYSNDMKYRYMRTNTEEYMLDLQTGKKVNLKDSIFTESYLDKIVWSPAGHQMAVEQHARTSNSQDSYMYMQSCKEVTKCSYPFGSPDKGMPGYYDLSDNQRIIGWAKDGKSYYVADLASIHYSDFSPEKLGPSYNVIELRS